MHTASRRTTLLAAASAAVLTLAACGSDPAPEPAAAGTPAGAITVVTTTNVYAAVVTAVGGDAVAVTAVLDSPAADPHSFEATPQVALEISDAQLVLMNGGGYDDFMTTMLDAAANKPLVINAVDVSGLAGEEGHDHDDETGAATASAEATTADDGHDHGEFNEHVFYDLDSMIKVSHEIAHELAELDAAKAATFEANADTFAAKLGELKTKAAAIGAAHPGAQAIATEPVLGYLLEDAGISNVTPEAFSEAVENETDPSVADVADVEALLDGGTVGVLAQNTQTSGPVIEQVVSAAEKAGVPVVGVTETFPEGVSDYVTWIDNTLTSLSAALDS